MIERICPVCQHGNPLDDRFCGKCGAALERQVLARFESSPLAVAARNLPVNWQQLGRTVALGAAALAAEVGIAWLRRRLEAGSAVRPTTALLPTRPAQANPATAQTIITIVSQRVIEVIDQGDGKRQIVDRHVWQRTEE